MKKVLEIASLIVLAIIFGIFVGINIQSKETYAAEPLQIISEVNTESPTVIVEEIVNGNLRGSIIGNVRFFLGGEQVHAQSGNLIDVPANVFLTNHVTVQVPEGMKFVASRYGKKYYSVHSAGGQRLTPKNRIYFQTEAEAQQAGYTY